MDETLIPLLPCVSLDEVLDFYQTLGFEVTYQQYDSFNTQSSSQWDGLRHNGHRQYGFYNGVTEEQIMGEGGARNGIEQWARRGIAGRGVLIDFPRFAAAHGIAFTLGARYGISARQL
jgi:hypothetical protein